VGKVMQDMMAISRNLVIFGNCQARQLGLILSALLRTSEFEISTFLNSPRAGNIKSKEEILSAIRDCDVLIYQPLSSSHGELCDANIKQTIKNNCVRISFPYLFNSGIYSLCHAPASKVHSYGMIFGEEAIIDQLRSGKSKEEIVDDYREGNINFNLLRRFNESLAEMGNRESSTNIKLVEFIKQKYKNEKLFMTHNHPSNVLFYEIIRQIMDIVPLPINPISINKLTVPDLLETNCPITPYDIKIHGYKFDAHKDWLMKGESLIELIVDNYLVEQGT
jgi:hypothetical protein